MPNREFKSRLPESELGDSRCFGAGYTFHGDVVLSAWNGDLANEPEDCHVFRMHHGGEVILIAALMGYYARLGIGEEQFRVDFEEAKQSAFDGYDIKPADHVQGSNDSLEYYTGGGPCPAFDEEELHLKCLVPPIAAVPGILERVGGTGIYTKREEIGRLALVLASIMPSGNADGQTKIVNMASFSPVDVPAMADMVTKLSLGEYRQAIQDLYLRIPLSLPRYATVVTEELSK